jgi:hypothetical protein
MELATRERLGHAIRTLGRGAGQQIIANAMLAQVPRAATLILLGAGAAGMVAITRKRRRQLTLN